MTNEWYNLKKHPAFKTKWEMTAIANRQITIEEFRIIGFYLYHVTSIRPSNSIGASGSLTASLNIDYDRGSSSYYC